MTPARKMILIAALVAVLYVISLAVAYRFGENNVEPTNSWVNVLNKLLAGNQNLDLQKDVTPAVGWIWSKGLWTVSNAASEPRLGITNSSKTIRKVTVVPRTGGEFCLKYMPRTNPTNASQNLDAEAVEVTVTNFDTNHSPVDLTILAHGGYLSVSGTPGPASLILMNRASTR